MKGGMGAIHFLKTEKSAMDTSRRLAILVFSAVPAIVGGGIVYAIFGSLTPMWIYEALLLERWEPWPAGKYLLRWALFGYPGRPKQGNAATRSRATS